MTFLQRIISYLKDPLAATADKVEDHDGDLGQDLGSVLVGGIDAGFRLARSSTGVRIAKH